MATLYDEIKEAEKILNLNPNEGDDDGEDDGAGVREERPVRGSAGHDAGKESEQGAGEDSGAGGRGGSPEGASRGEGGASSGDARASQEDRRRTQEDAPAPKENGEDVLKEPTNADFARQRRELRELKAKLAKLEAGEKPAPVAEQKEEPKPEAKTESAKEPDKTQNYQEWLEWKLQQQDSTIQEQAKLTRDYQEWKQKQETAREQERITNAAVEEFTRIEDAYKRENPDYGNAIDFARQKYVDAAKIFYPDKTEAQIEEAIDRQMLQYAANYAAKGLNPAEELYDLAIERFGYQKAEARAQEAEDKTVDQPRQKPNLRIVEGNKRRSATPLGNGGQGGSIPLTQAAVADMSIGEFSRLTPQDLANLEAMG